MTTFRLMSVKARGGVGRAAAELVEAALRFGGGAGASLGAASPAHTEMLSQCSHKGQQAGQHPDYRLHPESNTTLLVRLGEHRKQQGTLHQASAPPQTRQDGRQVQCHALLLPCSTCQGNREAAIYDHGGLQRPDAAPHLAVMHLLE